MHHQTIKLFTMISEEKINSNYLLYMKQLEGAGLDTKKLVEKFGENIKKGTYATSIDYKFCYDGSLITFSLDLLKTAIKINEILPKEVQADVKSLVKVCLLIFISKAEMYRKTCEDWKIKKGILYEFSPYEYALKTGIRSVQMCNECGIIFDAPEMEAMISIDRSPEESQVRYNSSLISGIVNSSLMLTTIKNKILV